MKYDKLVILDELFVTQMNHWSLFPIALTLMGVLSAFSGARKPDLLLWILCAILPILFFAVRRKVTKLLPFFLLHLAIAAIPFVIPAKDLVSRSLGIICGIYYLIYSLCRHFTPDTDGYDIQFSPVVSVCLSAGTFIIMHYKGTAAWDIYYIVSLIFVLGLTFFGGFLKKYIGFLSVNATSVGYVPEKEMFRSGAGNACVYTAGSILVLFLTSNVEWLAVPAAALKNILMAILRFLFSLIKTEEELPKEAAPIPANDNVMWMQSADSAQSFWLWDVLMGIAFVLFYLFAAYFLCRAIMRLIRFLIQRFSQKKTMETPKDELAVFDVREKCDMINSAGHFLADAKGQKLFSMLTPRERIRRLYKKHALAAQKLFCPDEPVENLSFQTARECMYLKTPSVTPIAELYEKARYSNEDISNTDVKQMKEICRKEFS